MLMLSITTLVINQQSFMQIEGYLIPRRLLVWLVPLVWCCVVQLFRLLFRP
jgi:hypothetical protein